MAGETVRLCTHGALHALMTDITEAMRRSHLYLKSAMGTYHVKAGDKFVHADGDIFTVVKVLDGTVVLQSEEGNRLSLVSESDLFTSFYLIQE